MIQTSNKKDGKLSIIARVGVKYIPFELEDSAQDRVGKQQASDSISAGDLIGLVLSGRARVSNNSSHARLLKRIEEEQQIPLQLDFTQSFLICEHTGNKSKLFLCLVQDEEAFDLKLLSEFASTEYPLAKKVPVEQLSLEGLKAMMDAGNISQSHPTVKRLTHWFADRVEVWGLAYG